MGKKGPCFHCGIDHTPLWRNGPPEKPVLCNACGSRWRIWGNLNNYTPKHSITMHPSKSKQHRISQKLKTEVNNAKRELFSANLKEETGNKSESGSASATIIVDNCINGGFWDQSIPRRKRSVHNQYTLSCTERLHRQLYSMLQDPEFAKLSEEQDELLFFPDKGSSSHEIGLGCVRLQSNPSS